MGTDWRDRHRGPFKLYVTRPGKKDGFITGAWLPGRVDSDDVEADAKALLADRRDDIQTVAVWSLREQQFVMTYKEGKWSNSAAPSKNAPRASRTRSVRPATATTTA